ncbi:caltractin-like [Brachionus plicatilis]|uniref:Caltractin-like n=1 Tax=Brachionus plicatilis TaxID=10195 RepID=A0A3M7QSB5_BRAPC|nr:caltractin-like [Brachionus plicatilis]
MCGHVYIRHGHLTVSSQLWEATQECLDKKPKIKYIPEYDLYLVSKNETIDESFEMYYEIIECGFTNCQCYRTQFDFNQYFTLNNSIKKVKLNKAEWQFSKCTCKAYFKDYLCKHIAASAVKTKLVEIHFSFKTIEYFLYNRSSKFNCLMPKSPKPAKKKFSIASTAMISSAAASSVYFKEVAQPTWLPPPEALGEKLLNAVEYKPLEEKDLFGLKISKRAIKNLSPAEIRDLVEVFQTFDRESKGHLNSQELFLSLKVLGFSISEPICEEYIQSETEGSSIKGLNVNQFLDLIIDKQGSSKDNYDEIINGFRLFDYDNSGYITLENLRRACADADCNLTETELREMIQEADQNGDGLIDQIEKNKLL